MLEKYMFTKLNLFLEGALDKEIKKAVKIRAIFGAIALALPIPVVSTIVYVIILWNTYSKIASICTVPFKDHLLGNIILAAIINVALSIASEFLAMIFGIGTLMVLFLGYASITISAMAYVKALKMAYKNRASRDLNWKAGVNNIKNNPGKIDKTINKFLE